MKKIIAVLLILWLLIPSALGEGIDLSKLSYDELTALRRSIEAEIMSRPEWKEITVPAGEWEVGVDIPAGSYSIEMATNKSGNLLVWGKAKNDYKSNGGLLVNISIVPDNRVIGKINLKGGTILDITCAVIIRPVKGLGF